MGKIVHFLQANFKNYLYITIGVGFVALAYNWFIISLGISAGGVSGIAIISNLLFGIPVAIVVYVLNISLLLIAFLFLDRSIFYRSIYGSLLLPFMLQIIPYWDILSGDPLLATIFGGIFMGLGFGVLFIYDGSTGGTSLVAYLLAKYLRLPKAFGLFFADSIIIGLNVLTGNVIGIFYGVFCIIIANVIANYFETRFTKKLSFYIISDERDKIQVYIQEEIKRETTIFHATVGYLEQPKDVMMGVVAPTELEKIKAFALSVDPSAFIIVGEPTAVYGQQFTLEKEQ